MSQPNTQSDRQYLQILSILHYVLGGLAGVCACFPVFHLAIGIWMLAGAPGAEGGNAPPPPQAVGWLFTVIAAGAMLLGWTLAILIILTGYFMGAQRHYIFCLVVAGLEAVVFFPLGTLLAVFTFIVLLRPGVKEMFERTSVISDQ